MANTKIPHFFRLMLTTLNSLATKLDRASECNLDYSNLVVLPLVADYFGRTIRKRVPMTEILVRLCVLLTCEVTDSIRLIVYTLFF